MEKDCREHGYYYQACSFLLGDAHGGDEVNNPASNGEYRMYSQSEVLVRAVAWYYYDALSYQNLYGKEKDGRLFGKL